MQIKRVEEGNEVVMPLFGMSVLKSLIDGILITMNPRESQGGLLFLSEDQLNEAGYFRRAEKCDIKSRDVINKKETIYVVERADEDEEG